MAPYQSNAALDEMPADNSVEEKEPVSISLVWDVYKVGHCAPGTVRGICVWRRSRWTELTNDDIEN